MASNVERWRNSSGLDWSALRSKAPKSAFCIYEEPLKFGEIAGIRVSMDDYLLARSRWLNEASKFSCPDACERYGCKEADLHITVSLVDLVALARVSRKRVSEIFRDHCKIGFDPLSEREPWTGRIFMELQKPCFFLQGKKCSAYAGRPIVCGLFPEAFFVLEGAEEALSKDIFRPFPCIQNPVPISPQRKTILRDLLIMSARENFLSDFYLFGISPLRVDLKNIAGEGLTGIEMTKEGVVKLPIKRLEEMVSKRIRDGQLWNGWESKLRSLDDPAEVEAFWRMKLWTDQMMEVTSRDPLNIVFQFMEGSLQSLRFCK